MWMVLFFVNFISNDDIFGIFSSFLFGGLCIGSVYYPHVYSVET